MSQMVYNVIAVALFALSLTCVASVPANLKSTLKIVNSTNIRELKHNFAAEDKTGAVAYVYPVGSDERDQSLWPSVAPISKTEAERTAAPKKLSSQVKDPKPSVNPTVKLGEEDAVQSTTSSSTAEKLEVKEVMQPTTDAKLDTTKTNSQNATTPSLSPPSPHGNQTAAHDNEKPDCVTRVLPSDETKTELVVYNATKQEVEAMGHIVFDTVCKGDDDWDKVIGAGSLASLCCGSG